MYEREGKGKGGREEDCDDREVFAFCSIVYEVRAYVCVMCDEISYLCFCGW